MVLNGDSIVLVVVAAHYLEDRNETADWDLENLWEGASPFDYRGRHLHLPYGPFLERFRKAFVRGASRLARCSVGGWSAGLQLDDTLNMV